MWLQVINKVTFTHQGEGHTKVKEKYLHPFQFYVAYTISKPVVCIRLKCILVFPSFYKCTLKFDVTRICDSYSVFYQKYIKEL